MPEGFGSYGVTGFEAGGGLCFVVAAGAADGKGNGAIADTDVFAIRRFGGADAIAWKRGGRGNESAARSCRGIVALPRREGADIGNGEKACGNEHDDKYEQNKVARQMTFPGLLLWRPAAIGNRRRVRRYILPTPLLLWRIWLLRGRNWHGHRGRRR